MCLVGVHNDFQDSDNRPFGRIQLSCHVES